MPDVNVVNINIYSTIILQLCSAAQESGRPENLEKGIFSDPVSAWGLPDNTFLAWFFFIYKELAHKKISVLTMLVGFPGSAVEKNLLAMKAEG